MTLVYWWWCTLTLVLFCVPHVAISFSTNKFVFENVHQTYIDYTYHGRVLGKWQDHLYNLTWIKQDVEVLARVPRDSFGIESSEEFLRQRYSMVQCGYTKHNTKLLRKQQAEIPPFLRAIADIVLETKEMMLLQPVIKIHKQLPGQIIPRHVDTYSEYASLKQLTSNQMRYVRRYLVFLNDGEDGHFFQVGHNTVLHHWHAGDVIEWPHGMHHLSVNAGCFPKYNLQITGINH
jgi:hypothetical protein